LTLKKSIALICLTKRPFLSKYSIQCILGSIGWDLIS
jgi:hypothetical protein